MARIKILAVDDNIINLATIEQELKDKYDVVTVNSGDRAIRYLNKEKPDLILLDVQMALMDGIETLRKIRTMKDGASMPVIMLTAKKDRETVLEGSKLGIVDYVVKPFNAQDLQERINRALKKAGVLPVEDRELYDVVKQVLNELGSNNINGAIVKMEEILGFKMDEEIFGRMQNAKSRLRANDTETAERLLNRVLKILERTVGTNEPDKYPVSTGELYERLMQVLNDLENFKVKDASQKVEELLGFDIPTIVMESCIAAHERLSEFDDEAAEGLIQQALTEVKNQLM